MVGRWCMKLQKTKRSLPTYYVEGALEITISSFNSLFTSQTFMIALRCGSLLFLSDFHESIVPIQSSTSGVHVELSLGHMEHGCQSHSYLGSMPHNSDSPPVYVTVLWESGFGNGARGGGRSGRQCDCPWSTCSVACRPLDATLSSGLVFVAVDGVKCFSI